MGSERNLSAVAPILLTTNGGTEGQVHLATTLGLFVKQVVTLQAPLLPPLNVEIKYVVSTTFVLVGPVGGSLNHRVDVSAYTTAAGSFLFAAAQQKAALSMESRLYASYIQEPSNSWRVTPVDSFGNSFDSTNPLPVTATITPTPGTIPIKWTDIELSYDSNANLTGVEYLEGATVEQVLTLTYDSNGNLINVAAAD